jgi:hypothetical protein
MYQLERLAEPLAKSAAEVGRSKKNPQPLTGLEDSK